MPKSVNLSELKKSCTVRCSFRFKTKEEKVKLKEREKMNGDADDLNFPFGDVKIAEKKNKRNCQSRYFSFCSTFKRRRRLKIFNIRKGAFESLRRQRFTLRKVSAFAMSIVFSFLLS